MKTSLALTSLFATAGLAGLAAAEAGLLSASFTPEAGLSLFAVGTSLAVFFADYARRPRASLRSRPLLLPAGAAFTSPQATLVAARRAAPARARLCRSSLQPVC